MDCAGIECEMWMLNENYRGVFLPGFYCYEHIMAYVYFCLNRFRKRKSEKKNGKENKYTIIIYKDQIEDVIEV